MSSLGKIGPGSSWTCWLLPVHWWRWPSIWRPDSWVEDGFLWMGWDGHVWDEQNEKLWCVRETTVFSFYILASPQVVKSEKYSKNEIDSYMRRQFFWDLETISPEGWETVPTSNIHQCGQCGQAANWELTFKALRLSESFAQLGRWCLQ